MAPPARRWLPTLDTVRLVLAPALVFIVTGLDRGYQTELWQHLARGRVIAREQAIVSIDRFTFTVRGRALHDNNWLSQLLYHGLHTVGGLELVQVVNSLTLAAAVGLLVQLCRQASRSTGVAGAVGVCVFLGLWQTLLIRPQSFSMLLFVAMYALLLHVDTKPRLLWIVPPLMALWANVHGGFGIGLLLIGTFVASATASRLFNRANERRPIWRWLACLASSAVATLLNPYGWRVYQYAGNLSALGVARGIEEWMPPSFDTLVGASFIVSLVGVGILLLRSRRHVTLQDACILACFALPACMAVRMSVWWFIAAAPIAARLAGAAMQSLPEVDLAHRHWRAAAGAVAAIMAVCVGSLPWLDRYSPLIGITRSAHRTESDLDRLAVALPAGTPVFTRMEWANYVSWRLEGRSPVFVEGHVELYPAETWEQYVTVNDARPGWRQVLDTYEVRFLLLDQTYHRALLSEVRRCNEWSPQAASGPAILFERRASPEHAAGDFSPTQ